MFLKTKVVAGQKGINLQNEAIRKISKSLLRCYTLPKFQTLSKLINLIINNFCSILYRKTSDGWVCAVNTPKEKKLFGHSLEQK